MEKLTCRQDTALNLKKCEKCGDFKEFLRQKIEVKGILIADERILPQQCYCEKEEEKKQAEIAQKQADQQKLMEKYNAANIPPRFLNWDFSKVDESENKKVCQKYVDCFDINLLAGKGLYLVGNIGTGKSTLCYCIIKELIKKGYTARIVSFKEIIRELQATNAQNSKKTYDEVMRDFLKFDFTVIDDFGRETYTENQLTTAFEFVNEMNKNLKCVAVTANPEIIAYMKSDDFKHKAAFKAILDRLGQMADTVLSFDGNSLR